MAKYSGVVEITLDLLKFEGQVSRFERAGKNLKSSTSAVSNPSQCQGLVLSDWVDIVRDIGEMLSDYKDLIEKDVYSLRDSQRAIEDADRDRADNIKAGGSASF